MLDTEDRILADTLHAARERATNGDIQGIRDLEMLARGGELAAMLVLAEEYAVPGYFQDLDKSEHWFRTAYETSPTNHSTFRYGHFLFAQDRCEEAKDIFSDGVRNGFGLCMYWLALVYLYETRSGGNYRPQIRQLLEGASAQGYAWATARLAVLLLKGQYGLSGIPHGVLLLLRTFAQGIPLLHRDPDDIRVRRNAR